MATQQLTLMERTWCDAALPIVVRSMAGREFTADDLHDVLPEPLQRNLFGVLIAHLKERRLIEKLGYRPSQRKAANGRVVAVWSVVKPDASL